MRATLRKYERLNSTKRIKTLFSHGESLSVYPVRAIFFYDAEQPQGLSPTQVLFTVSARSFRKASGRNLIRRRLKEAYRIHKHPLIEATRQLPGTLYLALIFTSRQTESYVLIEKAVIKLLNELAAKFITPSCENNPSKK
ncbi:MAG: ribonuclease P protein component [Bacteroidales bacterium]